MDVVKNKLKKVAKHIDKYKMTVKLLLISCFLQVICTIFPSFTDFLAFNLFSPLAILQLITYQLAHSSWSHLIGNYMYGLPFMCYCEYKLGSDKFLKSFILCGIGSLVLHLLMQGGSSSLIGSSGSIFGMCSLACMLFGKTPSEKIVSYLFLLFLVIPQMIMASFSLMMPTGIAYFGHVGGYFTALLLYKFLKK